MFPYTDVVSRPHRCQHHEFPDAYYAECHLVCKCDGHYNEFFVNKPTNEEVNSFCEALYIKGEKAKAIAQARRDKLTANNTDNYYNVTISIRNDYKQAVKAQYAILDKLRTVNNKNFSGKVGQVVFEYYTGEDGENWNPHIHCVVPKIPGSKKGLVAQGLNRIFYQTKDGKPIHKYGVGVTVDVRDCERAIILDYVNGNKQEKKMAGVDKDIEYRTKNNIPHLFDLNDIVILDK